MNQLICPRTNLPIYRRGMPFPDGRHIIRPGSRDSDETSMQMLRGDRTYSFDANMGLSDGAASYAASGYAQYQGADGIVDLGGNQNITITLPSIADSATITPQQARIDAMCVIDVTAGTFTGTALTKMILLGSNNSAFTAGTGIILGMMEFGAAASIDGPAGVAFITATPNAVGGSRYELPFTNEQNNVKYEFVKLYNLITNAGALTYRAFVAVLPEP
jgi:hypothetical protein